MSLNFDEKRIRRIQTLSPLVPVPIVKSDDIETGDLLFAVFLQRPPITDMAVADQKHVAVSDDVSRIEIGFNQEKFAVHSFIPAFTLLFIICFWKTINITNCGKIEKRIASRISGVVIFELEFCKLKISTISVENFSPP